MTDHAPPSLAESPLVWRWWHWAPAFVLSYVLGQVPLSFLSDKWPVSEAVAATLVTLVALRAVGRKALRPAALFLLLAAGPVVGFRVNSGLPAECTVCENVGDTRMFAVPGVSALYGLHVLIALAYLVSRARPERQRPGIELMIFAGLFSGQLLMLAMTVQLIQAILIVPFALLFFELVPVAGAICAPPILFVLYTIALIRRARRRAQDGGSLGVAGGIVGSPVLIGIYSVSQALWTHDSSAVVHAFTETCGATFSTMALQMKDCHYLCTVAARGPRWLVRPERWGVRGGRPILVNRQLAIANAFEALLHERWPRFGRWARRTYDRAGLPISRHLMTPWRAGLCYVLMKPFEWMFFMVLLLLDRTPPEERIDRMYR